MHNLLLKLSQVGFIVFLLMFLVGGTSATVPKQGSVREYAADSFGIFVSSETAAKVFVEESFPQEPQEPSITQPEQTPIKTPRPQPTNYEVAPERTTPKRTPAPEVPISEPEVLSYPSDYPMSYPSNSSSAGSTSAPSSARPKGSPPAANSKVAPLPVNSNNSLQSATTSSNTSPPASSDTSLPASPETQQPSTTSSETLPPSSDTGQVGNQPAAVLPITSSWLLPLIIGAAVLLLAGLVYSMWRKPKVNLNELTSVNEATSSPPQNTAAASLPQVNFKLMPNATPSHTIELISDANPGQTNGDNGSLAMNFDFALTMNHDGGDQTIATVSETANGSNGSLGMNTGMGLKINFDAGIQTFDSAASLLANQ